MVMGYGVFERKCLRERSIAAITIIVMWGALYIKYEFELKVQKVRTLKQAGVAVFHRRMRHAALRHFGVVVVSFLPIISTRQPAHCAGVTDTYTHTNQQPWSAVLVTFMPRGPSALLCCALTAESTSIRSHDSCCLSDHCRSSKS